MEKKGTNILIAAAVMILTALFFAGCTASQEDALSGNFEHTASQPEKHFNPDGTCYYTSQVDVRNTGSDAAENVMVRCSLKDTDTGSISDTESRYFEIIDPGDHKILTVNLDGECNKSYEVSVDITENYK